MEIKNFKVLAILLLSAFACVMLTAGCTGTDVSAQTATPTATAEQTVAATPAPAEAAQKEYADNELLIATTTSLYATGLLDQLAGEFMNDTGVDIKITAVGTGTALEYGANGDVDLIMVHDRARENAFIEDGSGTDRRVFGYNYFEIVGPESDPAGIKGMAPTEALETILAKGSEGTEGVKFVSRGDSSGTHGKEKALWSVAGYDYVEYEPVWVKEDWYVEAGTGMGGTLTMADEMDAYTLTDIGTYLKYKGDGTIDLAELVNEGDDLINIYGAILVNPDKYPDTNTEVGKDWVNYLISDDVQEEIKVFGVKDYGQPLFFPAMGSLDILSPSGVTQEEISAPIA
jgi:tungstate transport system substrate-binding protein